MKVVICLNNISHANALAKRLVELTDKISISIARWDGTPRKRAELGDDNNGVIVVDDDLAAACSNASILMDVLKEQFRAKTGGRLCCAADEKPVVIGVGSAAGGSGTTAAAVTMARILAGRLKGETALIFAGGTGNPMIYIEDAGKEGLAKSSLKTARELDYMLVHNIETDISRYITGDRYGPLTAVSAAEPRLLLEKLESLCAPEAAVLDLGSRDPAAYCHIYVELASCGDLRAADFEKKAAACETADSRLFFLNRTAAISNRDRFFCLPQDAESFRFDNERGQIEIAMDGLYAAAIRKAADEIIKMADGFKLKKVSIT
ncbi:MAG: hypothetical protein ACI4U1_02665 [Anaerovoracaceae bacterium]